MKCAVNCAFAFICRLALKNLSTPNKVQNVIVLNKLRFSDKKVSRRVILHLKRGNASTNGKTQYFSNKEKRNGFGTDTKSLNAHIVDAVK